mmetsp:Transcript_15627/g.27251  ORF Transcript_15627/g.27251 Transcript_15627/m.27251 type:complete len:197 (-) Transcript_15627:2745-3335(-)
MLWRPHPFIWQGMNYLVKLQSDARFYRKTLDKSCKDTVLFTDATYCNAPLREEKTLKEVCAIVNAETRVQCELKAEHKRLIVSGYYIPMLRWSPEDSVSNHTTNVSTRVSEQYNGIPSFDLSSNRHNPSGSYRSDSGNTSTKNAVSKPTSALRSKTRLATARESHESHENRDDTLDASQQHLDLLQRLREQIQSNT